MRKRPSLIVLVAVLAGLITYGAVGQLNVQVSNVGSVVGQTTGETEVFEQAQAGVLGLGFSPCDGASISGNGVIAVRGHLHTPSVGLNGVVSLTGKTTFTFS